MAAPGTAQLDVAEEDIGEARVLRASGELDLATAVRFCLRVDVARRSHCTAVVVDLSGLDFCDSTGLRALIGAGRELLAAGGRFAVVAPSEGAVADLFTVAGLRELLPLYEDFDSALEGMGR